MNWQLIALALEASTSPSAASPCCSRSRSRRGRTSACVLRGRHVAPSSIHPGRKTTSASRGPRACSQAAGSTPLVFLAALAINVPGAAYLVGLKDIAAAHSSTARDLVQVLGFNAIMFLLAEIPFAGLLVAPDATIERVDRVNAWFSRNGRTIAMALASALGVFLIVRGITRS